MNEFYAVSPKTFSNATEVGAVLSMFGFDKGRFLAALPTSFIKELYGVSDGFSEVEKMRVRRLVDNKKYTFLKLGLPYDGSKTWLENILHLLDSQELHGALTNEKVDSELFFNLYDVIDGELPSSGGVQDLATTENIIKYMRVILQTSQEVYLIDPYFSLAKEKYIKFVQELVKQPESRDTDYVFFCKKQHFETKESFESLAQRHLQDHMAQGCSIIVFPLENNTEMHGRYVFNIHGGVTYDKGFQVDESARVDFSVMPKKLHESYFEQYSELLKSKIEKHVHHAN